MKRFWIAAEAVETDAGWTVALDGRLVRTPAGHSLILPTHPLAHAMATEWAGVEGGVDPGRLRLTGLANAALDQVAPDPASFAATIEPYADTDLLCYRAASPTALVAAQEGAWDPPLDAFADAHGVDFVRVAGVIHATQPGLTREVLVRRLRDRDPFGLAALNLLVTTTGSLVLGLLVADHGWDPSRAWNAATLDECWQAERWGADEEAEARLAGLRRQFDAAVRFLGLLAQLPNTA